MFTLKIKSLNYCQVNTMEPDHEEHDYRMTWYHKVTWVLHDMITGAAPVVRNLGST